MISGVFCYLAGVDYYPKYDYAPNTNQKPKNNWRKIIIDEAIIREFLHSIFSSLKLASP